MHMARRAGGGIVPLAPTDVQGCLHGGKNTHSAKNERRSYTLDPYLHPARLPDLHPLRPHLQREPKVEMYGMRHRHHRPAELSAAQEIPAPSDVETEKAHQGHGTFNVGARIQYQARSKRDRVGETHCRTAKEKNRYSHPRLRLRKTGGAPGMVPDKIRGEPR
jgi:hypothetical protein